MNFSWAHGQKITHIRKTHQRADLLIQIPHSHNWYLWKGRKDDLIFRTTQRGLYSLSRGFKQCRIRLRFWCDLMISSSRAASLHRWLKTTGVRWCEPQSPTATRPSFFSFKAGKPLLEALNVSLVPLPESITNFLSLPLNWKCNCHFQ